MSKYMVWAIDPRQKPSASELRSAFADKEVYRKRQRADWVFEEASGVGIVPIRGALYTRDYLAVSAEVEHFNDRNDVHAIILDINSPGGVVSGAIECATTIMNSKKPVYAYIEGLGCSAAYLLASATKGIYASPASEIGSVGVQGAWTNYEGLFAKLGIQKVYFVSKHSEKKNLLPSTKEGKEAIKKLLDETWDIFAATIAKGRGVEVQDIIDRYGQGETYLAKEAKDNEMIDHIAENFDACVNEISDPVWVEGEEMEVKDITTVDALATAYPELVAQIRSDEHKAGVEEGQKAEKARVEGLLELSVHTDGLELITSAVKDGKDSNELMKAILEKQKADKEAQVKETQTELDTAVKQSEGEVVKQVTLESDVLFSEEEKAKARADEIAANIMGVEERK